MYTLLENSSLKNSTLKLSKRHILKTFSWRFIGTLDTILIGWLISGNAFIGLKIGVAEVITKLILYYLHEKVWYTSNFGLENRRQPTNE